MKYLNKTWRPPRLVAQGGVTYLRDHGKTGVVSIRELITGFGGYKYYEPWVPKNLPYSNSYLACHATSVLRPSVVFPSWKPPGVGDVATAALWQAGRLNPFTGAPDSSYTAMCYAKARNKLWEKIYGEGAELAVSIAEGREAIGAIIDRATKIRKAWSSLRKGDLVGFTNALGTRRMPKHLRTKWTKPKDAASLWLEYWMGWAPLFGDIHNSCLVLASNDLTPPTKISVRSGVKIALDTFDYSSSNGLTKYRLFGDDAEVMVGIGLSAQVTNPAAFMAAQLGVTNPASIIWAVVPFSFIADWFSNVGQWLDSYNWVTQRSASQFAGVKYSEAYVSSRLFCECTCRTELERHVVGRWREGTSVNTVCNSQRVMVSTLPSVPLVIKWPKSLSTTRAATAISLLASIFSKG